jgi:hypothetical protein
MPSHKEVLDRLGGVRGEANLADKFPQVFLGLSKENSNPTPFYCSFIFNGLILRKMHARFWCI